MNNSLPSVVEGTEKQKNEVSLCPVFRYQDNSLRCCGEWKMGRFFLVTGL